MSQLAATGQLKISKDMKAKLKKASGDCEKGQIVFVVIVGVVDVVVVVDDVYAILLMVS